jgi:mRNA interferase MazF
MINYNQYDIILVWFPDSNLKTVKKRPAIVLQSDDLNTNLDQLIIGMITSNLERKNHKSRIYIDIDSKIGLETGLLSNSVIMTDNITTVKIKEIYKKIGSYKEHEKVRIALRNTFGLY